MSVTSISMLRTFGISSISVIGSLSQARPLWNQQIRQLASKTTHSDATSESAYSEEDFSAAREWALRFKPDSLPKNLATTRFDRSSGKGGQHVNKTNSKATSTWTISSMAKHVPSMIIRELRASRYYSKNSDSLVIASQEGRVQRDNEEDTHQKLYAHIMDIAERIIPGETSELTKAKHEKLKKAENAARLRVKKMHGEKKQARSNRGSD